MFRRFACIAAGVLCFGVLAAVPAAAQNGPGYQVGATISLCSTTVFPGEPVTLSGENFEPGEGVTASINPVIGSTTVAADGTFSLRFTVPQLPPGTHTLTVRGSSGDLASTTFTVAAAPVVRPCFAPPTTPVTTPPVGVSPQGAVTAPPPSARGLAFTGAEISLMALAGAVVLIVGGMLVLTARKRRSAGV